MCCNTCLWPIADMIITAEVATKDGNSATSDPSSTRQATVFATRPRRRRASNPVCRLGWFSVSVRRDGSHVRTVSASNHGDELRPESTALHALLPRRTPDNTLIGRSAGGRDLGVSYADHFRARYADIERPPALSSPIYGNFLAGRRPADRIRPPDGYHMRITNGT